MPALSIYAPARSAKDLPDYRPQFDAAYQAMFAARDVFVRAQIELFRTQVPRGKVVVIPGADHFFTGHLVAMQNSLAGWLKEQFS